MAWSPEIKYVSFSVDEARAAKHYWRVVLGQEAAHLVHYGGESDVATVFTDPEPSESIGKRSWLGFAAGKLSSRNSANVELIGVPEDAREAMELAVEGVCVERSMDAEGILYLNRMGKDEALLFAEKSQFILESAASRQSA